MNNNSFWTRAKPLIKALNMTQRQFAEHMGFSHHTVRNWIYCDRVPEFSAAYDIAYTLGVTLDYLMTGKDRDIAGVRLREIEIRKTAALVMEKTEEIQEQLLLMRPLPKQWVRDEKAG